MSDSQMLINYVPGEECRVAIVEDNKLEELYVERFATASRVGNIYVGRVANVESAIQAAFVDFGIGENGFLHITDLHPRYFPGEGEETTERVGLKTPRRERPLIQHALRRGDEVIVQVLKEGVGTKGPTLTSYLSIPGRFLVMMPYMDKVGVSRKVEDEDQRREMRDILDQLELPEGFGFILRTAGMDRTKTDLKRDLAYLQRLWKDMERRLKAGGKPRLLYSESDLLVRSLRDLLTNDIGRVVIDSEVALARAARFMKIVAPRGTTKVFHYPGKSPIFHAFGIEKQIELIHAREVPLPSGGRLVIDQTEALVAIDVNSGKSRESRDAETNAYQTNIEAVDEICRQLRLRDMGGIVINDLIDMRRHEHRKDIENRFKERLKRDRAKSTVLAISEFGILEMTRQRMRPSHESTHFSDCPTCRGRGMVQKPDSIASDALRELAAILDIEKVHKVELAVSPRVAGELLSHKRQLLGRIERRYGKHVDVRVSEAVPIDRISFYAYDEQGADIDVTAAPRMRTPSSLTEWQEPKRVGEEEWAGDAEAEAKVIAEAEAAAEAQQHSEEIELHPIEIDDEDIIDEDLPPPPPQRDASTDGDGQARKGRRRRRGRGGRGEQGGRPDHGGRADQSGRSDASRPDHARAGQARGGQRSDQPAPSASDAPRESAADIGMEMLGITPPSQNNAEPAGEGGRRRRRRRRRGRGGRGGEPGAASQQDQPAGAPQGDAGESEAFDNSPSADDDRLPVENSDARGTPIGVNHQEPPAQPSSWDVEAPASDNANERHSTPQQGEDVDPELAASEDMPAQEADGRTGSVQDDRDGLADRGAEGDRGDDDRGDGGRRRRRRRRGRGGRGGGQGGPPAQTGQGGSAGTGHGGQGGQGGHGGRGGRGQARDGGRDRRDGGHSGGHSRDGRPRHPQPAQERPREPAPPPAQPQSQAPRPRTLYGAGRRKLSASELNKRPKPE